MNAPRVRIARSLATLATALLLAGERPAAGADEVVLRFETSTAAMVHSHWPQEPREELVGRVVQADQITVDGLDPFLFGGRVQGLLRFDGLVGDGAGQIAPGSRVVSARLRLVTTNPGDGADLHRLLVPFDELATWGGFEGGVQADDAESVSLAEASVRRVRRGVTEIDVTASVQAWADGAANHGWLLRPVSGLDGWDFWIGSAVEAENRPVLSVVIESEGDSLIVAAGDVTDGHVVLWAKATTDGPLVFQMSPEPDFDTLLVEELLDVADPLVPAKLIVEGLASGQTYYYRATDAAGRSASGVFRTAAAAGEGRGLRFGVTGDWRGELNPYPAISNMAEAELDLLIALGDTIYADVPSPAVPVAQCVTLEEFRRKHAEPLAARFGVASWAQVRSATTILATIDDHEVTNDFAGGVSPASDPRFAAFADDFINQTELFDNGMQAFVEYHPIEDELYAATGDPVVDGRRKLYRARRFGDDAAIFVLDARSFRDEPIADVRDVGALLNIERFRAEAFTPERTMLGRPQFDELSADLLAAEQAGVTWKFVLVPEPIQNLGPLAAADRFEGYAWERTRLLRFIAENGIRNVVFIAADIHCTIINNLQYQLEHGGRQMDVAAWEITTGAVAYAAPFGPTVVEIASSIPVFGPIFELIYQTQDRRGRDEMLTGGMDFLLDRWGYDRIGLDGSGLPARLTAGGWTSLHTYGWTLFEVDAQTQELTVTTYGIDWYDETELLADPAEVLCREPQVVSRVVVQAAP